jgi:predicted nucleotidyltransferase
MTKNDDHEHLARLIEIASRPGHAGGHEQAEAVLKAALRNVRGLDAALIYGSIAHRSARADSDVDVLVVGGARLDRRALSLRCVEAGIALGRRVDAQIYSLADLAEWLADPHRLRWHYIHNVLTGPRVWVAGRRQAVARVERLCAAAAQRP